MIDPIIIVIGGQVLRGWLEMSLRRSKKEMTGEMSCSIFFTHVPRNVTNRQAVAGAEVLVYIGGHLAFTGTLDERRGKGKAGSRSGAGPGKSRSIGRGDQTRGGGYTASAGAEHYTVTMRARGKTKNLIDSSHTDKKSQYTGIKTKEAYQKLTKDFKVPLQWMAPVFDMDKLRLRDGCTVKDECYRIANNHAYYNYETRDGKLRVTDGVGPGVGEPLILGDNILEFTVEQSEAPKNSEIKAKGQRTKKNVRGREAVNREKTVRPKSEGGIKRFTPLGLQFNGGDGTDDSLMRRAKFEADNQNQDAKTVKVDVFHVMSRTGAPWDIGQVHYVQIHTEGVFEPMECTELNYVCNSEKTLKTSLTLSPLPGASGMGGGSGGGGGIGGGGLAQFGLPQIAAAAGGTLDGLAGLAAPLPAMVAAVTKLMPPMAGAIAGLGGFSSLALIAPILSDMIGMGQAARAQLGDAYAEGQYPESWGMLGFESSDPVGGGFTPPSDPSYGSRGSSAGSGSGSGTSGSGGQFSSTGLADRQVAELPPESPPLEWTDAE